MRIKPFLKEETKVVIPDKIVGEVFVYAFPLNNYEKKDLLKSNGEHRFRFIADSKTKKVYIFATDLVHDQVDKKLGINGYARYDIKDPIIYGEAEYYPAEGFRFLISYSVNEVISIGKRIAPLLIKMADTDWSFMTKYIKGFDGTLKKIKQKADKYRVIKEEFVEMVRRKENDEPVSIYSFPLSNEEKVEISKIPETIGARFIADPERKKVYIFNAQILHQTVDRVLKINKYQNEDSVVVYGYVDPKTYNIIEISNISAVIFLKHKKVIENFLKTDWSFMTKYISGFESYLKDLKRVFGRIK